MSFSQQILDAINKVRQNPKSFVPLLEEKLKYFKGNHLSLPGQITLVTNEGPSAVKECIEFLEKAKPCEKLEWNKNMSRAAQDHCDDIGPKGQTSHDGSNGSTMSSRLETYGDWSGQIGENISFGQKTPEGVVMQLIVDDGVASRGHRKNIFNPKFQYCGIGNAQHKTYEICVVQDFAGEYSEKGAKPTFKQEEQKVAPQQIKDPNVVKSSTSTSSKTVNGKTTTTVTTTQTMKDGSTKTTTNTTIKG